MGGLVIETIRPGVQFVPEAARAFRRANGQVRAEFGRDIDVNSTYRDWGTQLRMYNAWQAWITGRGPYPGHSKALHPSDPLAFHTKGTALDSDDWTNARIVAILAENGFIRNRLDVPNENHHFEYIRSKDKNYHKEDDLTPEQDKMLRRIDAAIRNGSKKDKVSDGIVTTIIKRIDAAIRNGSAKAGVSDGVVTQVIKRLERQVASQAATTAGLSAAVKALSEQQGIDPEVIQRSIDAAVRDALADIEITLKAE